LILPIDNIRIILYNNVITIKEEVMEENYFLDGEFDVEELDIEELAHKDWDCSYQEVSWEERNGQF